METSKSSKKSCTDKDLKIFSSFFSQMNVTQSIESIPSNCWVASMLFCWVIISSKFISKCIFEGMVFFFLWKWRRNFVEM